MQGLSQHHCFFPTNPYGSFLEIRPIRPTFSPCGRGKGSLAKIWMPLGAECRPRKMGWKKNDIFTARHVGKECYSRTTLSSWMQLVVFILEFWGGQWWTANSTVWLPAPAGNFPAVQIERELEGLAAFHFKEANISAQHGHLHISNRQLWIR